MTVLTTTLWHTFVENLTKVYGSRNEPVVRIMGRFNLTLTEAEQMYLRGVRVATGRFSEKYGYEIGPGKTYFVKPGDWRRGGSFKDCTAVIWHGPGHQSKSGCDVKEKHTQHHVDTGKDEYFWSKKVASSGFFDESPEENKNE